MPVMMHMKSMLHDGLRFINAEKFGRLFHHVRECINFLIDPVIRSGLGTPSIGGWWLDTRNNAALLLFQVTRCITTRIYSCQFVIEAVQTRLLSASISISSACPPIHQYFTPLVQVHIDISFRDVMAASGRAGKESSVEILRRLLIVGMMRFKSLSFAAWQRRLLHVHFRFYLGWKGSMLGVWYGTIANFFRRPMTASGRLLCSFAHPHYLCCAFNPGREHLSDEICEGCLRDFFCRRDHRTDADAITKSFWDNRETPWMTKRSDESCRRNHDLETPRHT